MIGGLLSSLGSAGNGLLALLGGQAEAAQLPPWLQQGSGPGSVPFAGAGGLNPMQQAPSGPSIGDRLMAGFQGFVNSGGPLPALGNLVSGLVTGQRSDPAGARQQQMMMTYAALKARGVSDADARAAVTNPEFMKAILPSAVPKFDQFNNGPVYGGFNPATGRVTVQGAVPKFEKLSPGETGGEYTPTLPGANLPAAPPPNDPTMSIPPRQVAAANAPGSAAPMTPTPVQTTPIPRAAGGFRPLTSGGSVVQNEADKAEGKAQGEARHAYPETVATIASTIENVRKLKDHEGTEWNLGVARPVGWLASNLGAEMSSDFRARLEQVKSRVWMSSVQQLRGMGALSNAEGSRVEQAAARLQTTQNPKVFKESLEEIEQTLTAGLTRAKLQAFGQQRMNSGAGNLPPPPRGFQVVQ